MLLSSIPQKVRIVEVAPRDGLQNVSTVLPTDQKIALVEDLAAAGHTHIEVSSFVREDLVPQLADAEAVFAGLKHREGITYTALVANEKGLDRALRSGVLSIAVFTAASDTFSQKNAGCDVATSLARLEPVVSRALAQALRLRAYVSTAFVCPYEGPIAPERVNAVVNKLEGLGLTSISLGDTIGAATPISVDQLLDTLEPGTRSSDLALHMHDTCHRALANILVGLQYGVAEYDASAGGLGGCPFAPGAPGNVDTRSLVEMLESMGITTSIDVEKQDKAIARLRKAMGRTGLNVEGVQEADTTE